jgi:hypothetical protein
MRSNWAIMKRKILGAKKTDSMSLSQRADTLKEVSGLAYSASKHFLLSLFTIRNELSFQFT